MEEITIPVEYNRDAQLWLANDLIRSPQDSLTLLEARLIRLAIAQVVKDEEDFRTYKCNVADLARFLNVSSENIYTEAQNFGKNLMTKTITMYNKEEPVKKGKKNYKIIHWLSSVSYSNGEITFKLSEELKPYVLGLDKLFTIIGYEDILALPTNYSIRLYELLKSLVNYKYDNVRRYYNPFTFEGCEKGEFRYTVEYLKKYFDCENKYPKTNDFIKRVIDSSITAINEKTTLKPSYRTIKSGNKITHIVFKPHDIKTTGMFEELRQRYNYEV